MDIKDIQRQFKMCASKLEDYELMSKTELANGYCDAQEAGDEDLRSAYYSALMLRYWYKIFKWQQDSASLHLELSDFVDWLQDAFYVVFYYKEWRYEYKAEVKEGNFLGWKLDKEGNKIPNPYYWRTDPNAPDKIINRCCFSIRGKYYQFNNKDKRKANVTNMSIEKEVDENGDSALDYLGCVDENGFIDGTKDIITMLISKNKLVEAVVVDGIVNGDSFKTTKLDMAGAFDMRKLVKYLNNMNQKYIREIFAKQYGLKASQQEELILKMEKLSNISLYKYIKKTLIEIKENPDLLSCLVNL